MEEADELCNRVAIIDHGKILVCDTPANLKSSVGAQKVIHLQLKGEADEVFLRVLKEQAGVKNVESTKEGVRIFVDNLDGLLPRIIEAAGARLKDISISETTLETVFIKLTGRDLRE
jgi:ABC-2 type transport system ATP-binding protein